MRRELKYQITDKEYSQVFKCMNSILNIDGHTINNRSYDIKTLYFDNIYDELLYENINGNLNRKKFRIREYNLSGIFYLEKKQKNNDVIIKQREEITANEVRYILQGELNKLSLDTELKKEFYIELKTRTLKPIIVITYNRIAFEDKKIDLRITLDRDMSSSYDVNSFLSSNKTLYQQTKLRVNILEIKYSGYIPEYLIKMINTKNQRKGISKYKIMRMAKNVK